MDEECRTCGRCKGKASLEGVVEHATDVNYTAMHIPLGTARVEGGARIYYACPCGSRFSFISRLRRARYVGATIFGLVFGWFWWWMATGMGRRNSFSSNSSDELGPFMLMAFAFGIVAAFSFLAILADAYSRLRNPRWRGD